MFLTVGTVMIISTESAFQCHLSGLSCLLVSCIFSPDLNAGIPRYGQDEHLNASPR